MVADRDFSRWGEPLAPLLPQTLRRAFATEGLPGWVEKDLELPTGSTALALDASIWRRVEYIPLRIEHFILTLLSNRIANFRDLRVVEGSWPCSIDPMAIAWPTRICTALRMAHLLVNEALSKMTYGDLLNLKGIGIKSALEYAVIAEAVASLSNATNPQSGLFRHVLDDVTREALMAADEEEWAERVRADDPRFRDIAPPYPGYLNELFDEALHNPEGARSQEIAASLPAIRARAHEIASEPLDVAFLRLLRCISDSDRNVEVVGTRLGWNARGPLTLQETGDAFSVTRERVRQILSRALRRCGTRPYLPQLEQADAVLTDNAPLSMRDAAILLVNKGATSTPISPEAIKNVAELLGYQVSFHIERRKRSKLVLASRLSGTRQVFKAARRETGRVGVSNIEEVHAALQTKGITLEADAVSRILKSDPSISFLNEEWFWMPNIPIDRNRLRNTTLRMLSVTDRLSLPTIRQGVRRSYRFRKINLVPPASILQEFFRAHPEFKVDRDGIVTTAGDLDYRDILGDSERIFVDVLLASPTGLLDRTTFQKAVTDRGVNPNTFSVFASYSPILEHPDLNIWCLRGHRIDPAQLEALREAIANRPRKRRTVAYGWDSDGALRLTVIVGNVNAPVIGIPAAITRYVAGRQFQAKTLEKTPAGTIVINDRGTSWGYGPFLRRRGAEPGDALTTCFDLAAGEVTLALEDEDILYDNG